MIVQVVMIIKIVKVLIIIIIQEFVVINIVKVIIIIDALYFIQLILMLWLYLTIVVISKKFIWPEISIIIQLRLNFILQFDITD
jgi:hypothetical protein